MDYIKFKDNFNNKLDNNSFTTIRVDNPVRYQLGNVYKIMYPGGEFYAMIVGMKLVYTLDEIPLKLIESDTGLTSMEEFKNLMKEFYGDTERMKWNILTLKKVKGWN